MFIKLPIWYCDKKHVLFSFCSWIFFIRTVYQYLDLLHLQVEDSDSAEESWEPRERRRETSHSRRGRAGEQRRGGRRAGRRGGRQGGRRETDTAQLEPAVEGAARGQRGRGRRRGRGRGRGVSRGRGRGRVTTADQARVIGLQEQRRNQLQVLVVLKRLNINHYDHCNRNLSVCK